MRYDLSDKSVLVWDYGNYPDAAIRLSKDYGTVYYYIPSILNGFEEHTPKVIGSDIPNVIKIDSWASVINEIDLVYFCDSAEPYVQDFFRHTMGKLVFGSAHACRLEHDRKFLKEVMKELGLPVNTYYVAEGIDELDELLKGTKDVYVKSRLRGDSETWHHEDYRLSKREIKRLRHEMGLYENKETYIIEEPIDGIAEIGMDTFCCDGQYPDMVMAGIEIKDAGFAGVMQYYKLLPEQLRMVGNAFTPIFNDMGYRGHYSNEVIISKDKRGFLIDNTCRLPQPPGSLMMHMYSNYSEIVWKVASGIIPQINFDKKWGVQLIIKSDIAENDPSPILIPESIQPFVSIKNMTIDEDGVYWYTPNGIAMKEIGSICAMGNSLDEAIKYAKEMADEIKGFDTYIKTDSLDKAKKSFDKLSKAGISIV